MWNKCECLNRGRSPAGCRMTSKNHSASFTLALWCFAALWFLLCIRRRGLPVLKANMHSNALCAESWSQTVSCISWEKEQQFGEKRRQCKQVLFSSGLALTLGIFFLTCNISLVLWWWEQKLNSIGFHVDVTLEHTATNVGLWAHQLNVTFGKL